MTAKQRQMKKPTKKDTTPSWADSDLVTITVVLEVKPSFTDEHRGVLNDRVKEAVDINLDILKDVRKHVNFVYVVPSTTE